MAPTSVAVSRDGPVALVELARPEVRNAFNAAMIAELHAAFETLGLDPSVRCIVIAGRGNSFCGGADVAWMRASLELSHDANVEDARAMSRMFRAIDRCPKPVIGRIHGAALGGGAGLAAVCDVAIASAETIFGFTETKLGILPAVISPFVVAKIGATHVRALALTGERFDARRAQTIGLVHETCVSDVALEAAIERVVREILTASPSGIAATKALVAQVVDSNYEQTLELTAEAIAAQRTSVEGQDGLRAFLEKRSPAWVR